MEQGEIGLFDDGGKPILKMPINFWDARNDSDNPSICISIEGAELEKLFKTPITLNDVLQISLPFHTVREMVK